MKWIFTIIASAGLLSLGFISKNKNKVCSKKLSAVSVKGSYQPVAVLELFTSEGCSSCPSADKLLPQLAKLDPNIIPLSFHVDYWNRLGWEDPFSSSVFTERQNDYARQMNLESIYTPQLVVNGEYELVGSNRSKAETAIQEALKENSQVKIDINNVKLDGNKLSFTTLFTGDLKRTDLHAVIVQKTASIKVKAGENGGATLSHTNIVRVFETKPAAATTSFELAFPENLGNDNWELIVYAQLKDLKITGATIYSVK